MSVKVSSRNIQGVLKSSGQEDLPFRVALGLCRAEPCLCKYQVIKVR